MAYAGLKSSLYGGVGKDDERVKAGWDTRTESIPKDNRTCRSAGTVPSRRGAEGNTHSGECVTV